MKEAVYHTLGARTMTSEDDTITLLQELIEVSKQNQRWLRIIARDGVQETIKSDLSEPWEYHLFEELDGNASIGELADGLPPSDSTVGRRLKRWQQMGIVDQTNSGQYEKIESLELLGIEIPELNDDE